MSNPHYGALTELQQAVVDRVVNDDLDLLTRPSFMRITWGAETRMARLTPLPEIVDPRFTDMIRRHLDDCVYAAFTGMAVQSLPASPPPTSRSPKSPGYVPRWAKAKERRP